MILSFYGPYCHLLSSFQENILHLPRFLTLFLYCCHSSHTHQASSISKIKGCYERNKNIFTLRKAVLLRHHRLRILQLWASLGTYHDRSSYERCSSKQVFLRILQYSQEKTCVGVSFEYICRPSCPKGLKGLHWL